MTFLEKCHLSRTVFRNPPLSSPFLEIYPLFRHFSVNLDWEVISKVATRDGKSRENGHFSGYIHVIS